jgi:hypothetical protein
MGNPTQLGYKTPYPRRPETDVAKFGDPSSSTAGREEKTKPKLSFEKHTHKTELHSPATSTASHSILELTHKEYNTHVFQSQNCQNGAIQNPSQVT